MQEAEEQDTCRICSAPAEPGQPLFHPCKCSGTIRYIHQDCLTTWLSHSRKKTCDVCKYPYSFTKVYAPDMPARLPLWLLLRGIFDQVSATTLLILRGFIVATVWLAIIPYTTVWAWRVYFGLGDALAWGLSGRQRPHSTEDVVEGAVEAIANNGTMLEAGAMEAMIETVREAMSSDIFTGQIIASCVILCFVGVFLLKEWITQNAPPGLLDGEDINANAVQQPDVAPPLPQPGQAVRRNVRARAERVIMAQGQVEALAALDELRARGQQADAFQGLPPLPAHLKGKERETKEDRLAIMRLKKRQQILEKDPSSLFDEPKQKRGPVNRRVMLARETRKRRESDSPPTTQLPFSLSPSSTPPPLPEKPRVVPREIPESFFNSANPRPPRLQGSPVVEFGQPTPFTFSAPRDVRQASSSSAPPTETSGSAPGILTNLDNLSTATSASTPASGTPLRRPPLLPSTSAVLPEVSRSAPVSPMVSPSLATYHPPEELAADPGYFDELERAEVRNRIVQHLDNIQIKVDVVIERRHEEHEDLPQATEEVTGYAEASGSGSGSASSSASTLPVPADADEAETLRADSEDDGDAEPEVDADEYELEEEVPEVYVRANEGPAPPAPAVARPADPAILAAAELPYELRDDDEDTDDEWPIEENVQGVAIPIQEGPGEDGPVPVVAGPPPVDGAMAIPPILDDGEDAEDDMDGALHAIGMRGPFFGVVQNAFIMTFMLDVAMALAIFVPYMLGKTVGLLTVEPQRAWEILNLPLLGVRLLTDPVVDFIIMLFTHPKLTSMLLSAGSLVAAPFVKTLHAILAVMRGEEKAAEITELWLDTIQNTAQGGFDKLVDMLSSAPPASSEVIASTEVTQAWYAPAMEVLDPYISRGLDLAEPYFAPLGVVVREKATTFAQEWEGLVTGDGLRERIFAVAFGYFVVAIGLTVYLNMLSLGVIKDAGKQMRTTIYNQLLVVKVAGIILVELIVFPATCGIFLDLSTLWILWESEMGKNFIARFNYFEQAPLTGLFFHWVAGTMFMYGFALLLAGCRTLLRPGAIWFIKDPQDQATHPIREILERSTFAQLRRIALSGVMYGCVVFLFVGSLGGLFSIVNAALLPFRWRNREPLSSVPIDIVLLNLLLPYTMHYFRPKKAVRRAALVVWRSLAHKLRLSSYLFGDRNWAEEWSSAAKKTLSKFPVTKPLPAQRDGCFFRVPAADSLTLSKGQKAAIPVMEDGKPVDDDAKMLMHKQDLEVLRMKRDPKEDFTIVYVPPQFRWRMFAFCAVIWTLGVTALGTALVSPILIGRQTFSVVFGLDDVHDGYSFLVGFYLVWACYVFGRSVDRLDKRRQRRATNEPVTNRADLSLLVLKRGMVWVSKISYMIATLGVVVPILLAILIDVYIMFGVRVLTGKEDFVPTIRIADSWAVGVLYMRITHAILNSEQNRDGYGPKDSIDLGIETIRRNGWTHPDPWSATTDVILPLVIGLSGMIALPVGLFVLAQQYLPDYLVMHDKRLYVVMMILNLGSGLVIIFRAKLSEMLRKWSQGLRDKAFLLEMRVKNHEPGSVPVNM